MSLNLLFFRILFITRKIISYSIETLVKDSRTYIFYAQLAES